MSDFGVDFSTGCCVELDVMCFEKQFSTGEVLVVHALLDDLLNMVGNVLAANFDITRIL